MMACFSFIDIRRIAASRCCQMYRNHFCNFSILVPANNSIWLLISLYKNRQNTYRVLLTFRIVPGDDRTVPPPIIIIIRCISIIIIRSSSVTITSSIISSSSMTISIVSSSPEFPFSVFCAGRNLIKGRGSASPTEDLKPVAFKGCADCLRQPAPRERESYSWIFCDGSLRTLLWLYRTIKS